MPEADSMIPISELLPSTCRSASLTSSGISASRSSSASSFTSKTVSSAGSCSMKRPHSSIRRIPSISTACEEALIASSIRTVLKSISKLPAVSTSAR